MDNVYLVKKTVRAYVIAGDEKSAKRVDVDEDYADVEVCAAVVDKDDYVPERWLDALPFGDYTERPQISVGDLLCRQGACDETR